MTADVTVLIATHDRAEETRATVERMLAALPADREVRIVVVDNNSTDSTKEVVRELAERGPVMYLFEPRPGKNCALNMALDTVELGRVVLFTDDDIDVEPGYFEAVLRACEEHPEASVFGGRQVPVWPGPVPGWALDPSILGWGFPILDLGPDARPFPGERNPIGGNLWVRREVFADGLRYDEKFGPRPKNRIMGSEISFVQTLRRKGHVPLYWPAALTGHRMRPEEVTPKAIRKRAFRAGRTGPHLGGLRDTETLRRSPLVWRAKRWASLARYGVLFGLHSLHPSVDRRTVRTVRDVRGWAYNLEALRVERASRFRVAPGR